MGGASGHLEGSIPGRCEGPELAREQGESPELTSMFYSVTERASSPLALSPCQPWARPSMSGSPSVSAIPLPGGPASPVVLGPDYSLGSFLSADCQRFACLHPIL